MNCIVKQFLGVFFKTDRNWLVLIPFSNLFLDMLGLPSSNSLSSSIVTLFNEQDDGLIEALLCLLDTHSGLQFGSYSARVGISCGQDEDDSMDFFNPIDAFEQFLSNIGHDSSVLLDICC